MYCIFLLTILNKFTKTKDNKICNKDDREANIMYDIDV